MTDGRGASRRGFLRMSGVATLGGLIGGAIQARLALTDGRGAAPVATPVLPTDTPTETAPVATPVLPTDTASALPTAAPPSAAGPTALTVHDARAYGTRGDDATDDTDAINAAIGAAAAAGGGIVYLPAGAYLVSPRPHPQDGSYAPCLLMRRGVLLRGAGKDATTVRLVDHATPPPGSVCVYLALNATINPAAADAARDERMVVEDLTLDGNAARQTAVTCGLVWIGCRDVQHARVRVRDVYGTGSVGGRAETFFYEFQLGAEASYSFCEAVATAGSTASGFSADSATGLTYVGCVASGLGVGSGFTHHACAILRHTDCHAYGNAMYGFNSEDAEDVRYTGCVAGGRADVGGRGAFGARQTLGNANAGFMVNGSRVVDLTGCSSRYNGGHGLWLAKETAGVRVMGGEYSANTGWGITATTGATDIALSHETRLAGNGAGALQAQADLNTASPFLYDSGWVRATTGGLALGHGLPSRPRAVTAYQAAGPAPADDALVSVYPGVVSASAAHIVVPDATADATYRIIATY